MPYKVAKQTRQQVPHATTECEKERGGRRPPDVGGRARWASVCLRWCGAEACPRSIVFPRGISTSQIMLSAGAPSSPPPTAPQPVPPSLHAPYVCHQNNLRFPWLSSPRRFYVSIQCRDKTRMHAAGCHLRGESNFQDLIRASCKTSAVCEEIHHKDDGSLCVKQTDPGSTSAWGMAKAL